MLREFFHRTFLDATGQPSATLATAFAVNASVALVLPVGLLTNRYPPVEILLAMVSYGALLLGLDFSLSRTKIIADNPAPVAAVGTLNADTINVTSDTAPQ